MLSDDMARFAIEHTPLELYWADFNGRFVEVNAAALRALGYSREQMFDLALWDVDPNFPPERWSAFVESLRQERHARLETLHRRRDGSCYPVEVTVSLVEHNGETLLFGLAQDISDRRRMERELQESEQRLRVLINSTPDIICFKDGAGRWLEANEADLELFALTEVDYRGKTDSELADYTHTTYRHSFLACEATDEAAWQAGRLSRAEEVIERFDGVVKIYDVIKVPVFEPDGRRKGLIVLGRDITERKCFEEALQEERGFLQNVIDGIDDPILVIGIDYQVLRMNRAARDIAERSGFIDHCAACYKLAAARQRPCNQDDHPCPLRTVRDTRQPCKLIRHYRAPDGALRQYEVAASPLFDEAGEVRAIIEVSRDISEHLALLDELRERELSYAHLAQHDPLTGLPNRLLFADRLSQSIHTAHRHRRRFAVLFIDLDRFKQVNDSFDHSYGDRVLTAVAERLRRLFREDDTIARMGGDEFTVILNHIRHDQDAATVASKILDLFKLPFEVLDHSLFLGASVGISLYPEHGTTVDDLVRNADTAMYRAKESGRNNFQYYSRELTAKAVERVRLESSLHRALERGELLLHYQPQVDLEHGRVRGLEALVRWQHPEAGLISPATFIPLAEESGIILAIGAWVLEQACGRMKDWLDRGLVTAETLISVNLSPKQFDQPNLVALIDRILTTTGLAAAQLELEITESTVMQSVEQAGDVLHRLRELGVKVAIDDFGTGYSSLIHLKRFPLTTLKIDKTFVSDIPHDANDTAITRAVIALAHSLSLEVLAEGVETQAQRAFLIDEGCPHGQGYLFSRPLDESGIEPFLRERLAQVESAVDSGARP
ncbi:EAL domain-containing protein [Allochromatium humboldtianum]|uniref:cyclic-guanylate-specific phosphodiesterase n=1 Tax=Allochromatium humboldtianum TaxID=504901 RepID=A0A850R8L2_9GAMM|nr:EAL domain-containing protein [Allochromatium humboldtianum]NVZ08706.1 EAL domain-containing protein [Allochromatium humboldtianum]